MKLKDLTIAQRKRLAPLAKTSDAVLRHLQHGQRPGTSAAFAIRVEKAAKRMGLDLRREDLCSACGGCDLARAGRKA